MKKLAILGDPVEHSLSPLIHGNFASQFNLDITYEKVSINSLNEVKCYIYRLGIDYLGFNITSPFKQQVFALVDEMGSDAKAIGALNTLFYKNNKILGFNTDGIGFVNDLKEKNIPIKNHNIVILGTGGGAKAVLHELLKENPKSITVVSRDLEKSIGVTKKCIDNLNKVTVLSESYETLGLNNKNFIINATSAGMQNELPPLKNYDLKNKYCYDLSYGDKARLFLKWAHLNNSNNVYDGLGMLIEQAAICFKIWFNKSPNTKLTLEFLKNYI